MLVLWAIVAAVLLAAAITAPSTAHASARVTGVASSYEKTTPSGVSIVSELLRRRHRASAFPLPRPPQRNAVSAISSQMPNPILSPYGNHRPVVLRDERLDDPGPHQHHRRAGHDREQIRADQRGSAPCASDGCPTRSARPPE